VNAAETWESLAMKLRIGLKPSEKYPKNQRPLEGYLATLQGDVLTGIIERVSQAVLLAKLLLQRSGRR
jgi:hypothetical protein